MYTRNCFIWNVDRSHIFSHRAWWRIRTVATLISCTFVKKCFNRIPYLSDRKKGCDIGVLWPNRTVAYRSSQKYRLWANSFALSTERLFRFKSTLRTENRATFEPFRWREPVWSWVTHYHKNVPGVLQKLTAQPTFKTETKVAKNRRLLFTNIQAWLKTRRGTDKNIYNKQWIDFLS